MQAIVERSVIAVVDFYWTSAIEHVVALLLWRCDGASCLFCNLATRIVRGKVTVVLRCWCILTLAKVDLLSLVQPLLEVSKLFLSTFTHL